MECRIGRASRRRVDRLDSRQQDGRVRWQPIAGCGHAGRDVADLRRRRRERRDPRSRVEGRRVSQDSTAAAIASDRDHPQDVVKYSVRQPGQVTRLTDVNGDVLQRIQIAKSEEITYASTGNAKVIGWVVKPPSFDPTKKYPLILE